MTTGVVEDSNPRSAATSGPPVAVELLILFVTGIVAARLNQYLCLALLGGGAIFLVVRHRESPSDVVGMVLAIHCMAPLLRRLHDLWHGFTPGSPILIASYCAYPALGFVLARKIHAFRRPVLAPALLALLGIGWAYLVGIRGSFAFAWAPSFQVLGDGILPPSIQLLQYLSGPFAFSYVVVNSGRIDLRRLGTWIAVLGLVEGLYGLYQWVSPPPWDVVWFKGSQSFLAGGRALPFQMRTFGTLNIVSPFSYFLVFSFLVVVELRRRAIVLPVILAALVSTMARSAWGTLVVALAVAGVVARPVARVRLVSGMLLVLFLTTVMALPFEERLEGVFHRVRTIQNIKGDNSFRQRSQLLSMAIEGGVFEDLVGTGLGASGSASRISGGGMGGIDNGFLQTAWIFGWTGASLYLGGFLLAVWMAVRRAGDLGMLQAKFLGIAIGFFVANIFESSFEDMKGAMLWFAIGLAGVDGSESEGDRS